MIVTIALSSFLGEDRRRTRENAPVGSAGHRSSMPSKPVIRKETLAGELGDAKADGGFVIVAR
ncbi:hypothetical protein [Phreatobacter cathodiphilus]|uniref:hypothetical protein n=1 Tax=Phreatobacter cathodiphilus TaxID=1868589 RepID=UPI0015E7CE87|nr:hypothetical protein [Phreatobacter cathodiphilus]